MPVKLLQVPCGTFQERFNATEIGTIESEEFYDFTISRPVIQIPDDKRVDLVAVNKNLCNKGVWFGT